MSEEKTKKTAKRQSPKGKMAKVPAYEFQIKESDVKKRAHFGSFEVIVTTGGIMFKNYSGFHIYTTPYAVGADGVAVKNSLYAWLENLVGTQEAFKDSLDEPFMDATYDDGRVMTKGDILEADKLITEGNLLQPMTAFVDLDEATRKAEDHMRWLTRMQEQLLEAMNSEPAPEEEAVKADAEEAAKVLAQEAVSDMVGEAIAEHPEILDEPSED